MGARPMQRLIQDTIRKALADELLFGRLVDGGRLTVDVDAEGRCSWTSSRPARAATSPRPRPRPPDDARPHKRAPSGALFGAGGGPRGPDPGGSSPEQRVQVGVVLTERLRVDEEGLGGTAKNSCGPSAP
jgi:hypothetical protein